MREEKKPNTLRGYESHWRHLRAWCETEGWEPTPADPYVVARFLIHRYEDDGLAAGSVTQAVQAIAHYHRDLAESLTEHRVVKKTMAGLRRRGPEGRQGHAQAGAGAYHRGPSAHPRNGLPPASVGAGQGVGGDGPHAGQAGDLGDRHHEGRASPAG